MIPTLEIMEYLSHTDPGDISPMEIMEHIGNLIGEIDEIPEPNLWVLDDGP